MRSGNVRKNMKNKKRKKHRRNRVSILQSAAIAVGLLMIAYIFIVSLRSIRDEQPQGQTVRLQDALILIEALDQTLCADSRYSELLEELNHQPEDTSQEDASETDRMLLFREFITLSELLLEKPGEGIPRLKEMILHYEEKYEESHVMLLTDWYDFYDALVEGWNLQDVIGTTELVVAGTGGNVSDTNGIPLEEGWMLTDLGTYAYRSDLFVQCQYQKILAYVKEGTLLTVRSHSEEELVFQNLWIMETSADRIQVFWYGHSTWVPYALAADVRREQVGDLSFRDGVLEEVRIKEEKIHGKLLRVTKESLEIEGVGTYPISEELKIYRLYEKLEECKRVNLAVGYDFTDFVLEDGEVCAALISRDDAMENIRVALRTQQFSGLYHEEAVMTADTAFTVHYGTYGERKSRDFSAGEELILKKGSEYLEGGRAVIVPAALTGRVSILSMQRSQGTPAYRGTVEVLETEEGLVLINELLLEEYLYSVVPSEMPASYPLEALKAQAVCARTYAYRYLMTPGMPEYGAHVDDSSGYQVYNNISENSQTTHAVRETTGKLLCFGDILCGTYYYSTSCGFGTDTGIWKSGAQEDTSYLQSRRIGLETEQDPAFTGESLKQEEVFRSFISQKFSADFESEEPWYRWSYRVEALEEEKILEILKNRYQAAPEMILTRNQEGEFESLEIKKIGELQDIFIVKRGPGGVADELILEGSKNTFKVISEYNIRCVLNDGVTRVIRQDGSEAASANLLPSAYIRIDLTKEEDRVTGYEITGGGFGHGAGMSQNGARAMAASGMSAEEILLFFYQACQIQQVY